MAVIVGIMQRALVLVQDRAVYLWVLFLIPATSRFGHYLAPNEPVFKGHDYGIWTALLLTLVAVALWIPYSRHGSWPKSVVAFFVIAAIAWTYQVVRIQLDDSLFNLTVIVVPVGLLLVALKRTSQQDLWIGLWVLGYSLLAISTTSLLLGSTGVLPNGFEVSGGGGSRFPVLAEFGLTRWGGPFGNVNYAAPIGGLLVVIGIAGRRRLGLPLIVGGLAILGLSQGRTALFAMLAAVTVQILWSQRLTSRRHTNVIRSATIAALLAGTATYVLFVDRTLNGRTHLWSDFAPTFDDAPLFGIGDSGVLARVAEQVGTPNFVPHTHAHSVLLDSYMRFGAIMAILGIVLYILALRASIRALTRVGSAPLAVVVFVIVAGLTETIYAWAHWSVYLVALTWAVMVSADEPEATSKPPDSGASVSWARESA